MYFVQNSTPEHDFCLGVMGSELTELQHTAYTSNALTCLINNGFIEVVYFRQQTVWLR